MQLTKTKREERKEECFSLSPKSAASGAGVGLGEGNKFGDLKKKEVNNMCWTLEHVCTRKHRAVCSQAILSPLFSA